MIYKNKEINIKKNKGYTLLFAVLVSSLVLSVGISILNISKKEYLLASSARESTVAFYAADSALECAAYYDIGPNKFVSANYVTNVTCAGGQPRVSDAGPAFTDNGSGTTVAIFDLNLNDTSCATVTVRKSSTETSIQSRGYNIGWDKVSKCNLASPKRVERVLYYTY